MTALTAVLLLYEPAGKYPRAIERLIAVLERLESVDASLIVVDNAREGDWEHQVSASLLQIGGDNRAWEFSAFDKGLAACERWRPETDVVALVTDAFEAYGREYLGLIDDGTIRCVTELSACVGWMDSWGFEECRIGELAYDTWMRSSFIFLPRQLVGPVSPLAADLPRELFGGEPERPFADGGPLSENLQQLLLEWLTTRPVSARRLPEQWHSRFELTAESLPFFHSKVRAILREHLISARLKAAGAACYDFRLLRQLGDAGRLGRFLEQGGDRERQWLGWRRSAAGAAAGGGEASAPATPDLPEIHHYWSTRHLRPKLRRFGLESPGDLFRRYAEKLCRAAPGRRRRFVSLGGGAPGFELELAERLLADGLTNFTLECAAVQPALLQRSRRLAERHGVAGHLELSTSPFASRRPAAGVDAVFANQSLRRTAGLEELLEAIRADLAADGYLLVYEVLERDGRPEELELARRLWLELPNRYRYNRLRGRLETDLPGGAAADDAGPAGPAGQEILPLLLERFHFELFIGFANLIDPFIDRAFGPNFDPARETDRAFIDRVHAADEEALAAGRVRPTRILAALTREDTGVELCDGELTAARAARRPAGE